MAIDAHDRVYVLNRSDHPVIVFDNEGKALTRWGNGAGRDKEKALFLAPHAIAIDSRADVYVGEVCLAYRGVDRGPRTLQKFARRT